MGLESNCIKLIKVRFICILKSLAFCTVLLMVVFAEITENWYSLLKAKI